MKKILLSTISIFLLTFTIQAQFTEMGQEFGSSLPVSVIGKDANGDLFGNYQSKLYKKADNIIDSWQLIASGSHFSKLAISERANYKMFSFSFNDFGKRKVIVKL